MDYLWSPWRYRYVSQAASSDRCIFCELAQQEPSHDRQNLVLHRGRYNLILVNLFPYTTGHSMVAPYAHVSNLDEVDQATLMEMMSFAQELLKAFKTCYNPEGCNLGMNLGKCAGAGVENHLHLHLLPRWTGDSNFMTVVGETRVQPEDLLTTYDKLARCFPRQSSPAG